MYTFQWHTLSIRFSKMSLGVVGNNDDSEKKSTVELDQKPSRDNDSASTEADQEEHEIEQELGPADIEHGAMTNEKALPKHSIESKRPTLSRVTSRITTHSYPDPGPPPDGGLQAWVQVAMSWLSVVATWGWVNCYGK